LAAQDQQEQYHGANLFKISYFLIGWPGFITGMIG